MPTPLLQPALDQITQAPSVNYFAAALGALLAFFFGGVWYSPRVFGHLWGQEEHQKKKEKGHSKIVFVFSGLFYLFSAWAFARYLGPLPSLETSLKFALTVGACFVSSSFGINYLFAGRGWRMFMIDAGYHFFQFAIYGLVLALWH